MKNLSRSADAWLTQAANSDEFADHVSMYALDQSSVFDWPIPQFVRAAVRCGGFPKTREAEI